MSPCHSQWLAHRLPTTAVPARTGGGRHKLACIPPQRTEDKVMNMKRWMTAALCLVAGTVNAEGSYAGSSLSLLGGVSATGMLAGKPLNQQLGVEVQYLGGAETRQFTAFGPSGPLALSGTSQFETFGAFLTVRTPAMERAELVARVGMTHTRISVFILSARQLETDLSASFGAGVRYHFTPRLIGALDYNVHNQKRKLQGPTLSLGYFF